MNNSTINANLGSSLMKFTFTDSDGDVLASFRMNPGDIKLAHRCQEVSSYFENLGNNTPEHATIEDAIKFNDVLEDKICYLLGYDAKQSLFGLLSATSIMEDGNMFAVHVMDKIVEHVGPEIQKRKQAMANAVKKYTAKYQ